MNNEFNIGSFNAPNAAVNLGGTIAGDQIGTQHQHVADSELQQIIAELKTALSQLQTQHPSVTTETAALAIIDAEFSEMQPTSNPRLAALRRQILNPERHLQATKATLGEVAKHYLEESVWAKAILAYVDKLSETPDQGV
ncbi:MAG: hypothetical protein AAFX78_14170 [Cyanobacteria bacterium J06638_20]